MKPSGLNIKATLLCLLFAGLIGCATVQTPQEAVEPVPRQSADAGKNLDVPFNISNVMIQPKTFNPSKEEMVTISCRLSKPAKAMIRIFDPDNQLVRELMTDDTGNPGEVSVTWDGLDMESNIVPDEAYYFTIEANEYGGALIQYDPLTFSGGEDVSFPVTHDRDKKGITYELAQDTRVIIRGGISRGPMLKRFVSWRPRPAGTNEEPWDGKDDSGAIHAAENESFIILSEGVTLPENSILTTGNQRYSYLEYKKERVSDRPLKEMRPRTIDKKELLTRQFVRPAHKGVSIDFQMALPESVGTTHDGLPMVTGKVPVKVTIDDSVKRFVTEQRYEILCYVDFRFAAEQEEGYSPSTWIWDSNKVANGEHVLTVNVATLTGNLATASLTVFVSN